jgi:formate-dependent nitrite reductase membrane component NrfD
MTLYFALANISTEAFRFSVELMLTEYMWATLLLYLLGFIGPFAVYFYNKKKPSKTNLLILAVLLILQSFLARYLLVYAGAMELPW